MTAPQRLKDQWVVALIAACLAGGGGFASAFALVPAQDLARKSEVLSLSAYAEDREDLIDRLARIEEKLDLLLQR